MLAKSNLWRQNLLLFSIFYFYPSPMSQRAQESAWHSARKHLLRPWLFMTNNGRKGKWEETDDGAREWSVRWRRRNKTSDEETSERERERGKDDYRRVSAFRFSLVITGLRAGRSDRGDFRQARDNGNSGLAPGPSILLDFGIYEFRMGFRLSGFWTGLLVCLRLQTISRLTGRWSPGSKASLSTWHHSFRLLLLILPTTCFLLFSSRPPWRVFTNNIAPTMTSFRQE